MRNGINIPALAIWNLSSDLYDHGQLAGNWDAVDNHDHTPNHGRPITTAAIADNAITNAQLATGSVTGDKIADGTIQTQDIAPGAITAPLLDPGLFTAIFPLGFVLPWFRPDPSIPIPSAFVLADGSTVPFGQHDYASIGTSITVPDMRNKFLLGAVTGAGGSGPGQAPGEQATGGSHVQNLNHTHTITPHSHTVNSHSHTVPAHDHLVGDGHDDGTHFHKWSGEEIHTRPVVQLNGGPLQAAYIANVGSGSGGMTVPMDTAGNHAHGGRTQGMLGSPTTGAQAPSTNTVSQTTDGASGAPSDFRPAYVGLLYIVKVRHI